ncbi:MAG: DUF3095 family protein [Pseudomonadota bacterium]
MSETSPHEFRDLATEAAYAPVHEDWHIAVTDVVGSRKASAAGRYKAVNMAGVALIAAVMNALDGAPFPFVFGGDGSALLVAPEHLSAVRQAMREVSAWVQRDLALELRTAIVPVARVRADGFDVKVATYRVSDDIINYAFCGGGTSYAEALMKQGDFRVAPDQNSPPPNLEGLSCRWTPVETAGHRILSIIIEARDTHTLVPERITAALLDLAAANGNQGSPMPVEGPGFTWPPQGLDLEARAAHGTGSLWGEKIKIYGITFIAWILDRTRKPLGAFDPVRYRIKTSANTDYRKIQDGLRMTLCLTPQQIETVRDLLEAEHESVRYGLCEQDQAVLTCLVPSIYSDAHYHFLDGTGGGYAEAATRMGA